jgi:hypothetical protein
MEARYELRAMAADDTDVPALVPGCPSRAEERRHQRHRQCGVELVGASADVRVFEGRGYWTGLETCGDAHACPVCAAKIRARRGAELREGLNLWTERGGYVSLITLTVAHDQEDVLGYLLRAEAQGWHKIVSGKAYQQLKERLGIAGTTTAAEETRGARGWHPHQHNLVWHDRYWQAEDFAAFHAYAFERWSAVCAAYGLRPPHPVHGVDLRPNANADATASYVTKLQEGDWTVAEEITRGDVKTGRKGSRTPFEILRWYYADGDRGDWLLWCEYLAAVKGKPVLRWSRGLKAVVFGPSDQPEAADADLAADEVGGQLVARHPPHVWARIRLAGLQLLIPYAAETGGLPAVNRLLAEHGCGWALPP